MQKRPLQILFTALGGSSFKARPDFRPGLILVCGFDERLRLSTPWKVI